MTKKKQPLISYVDIDELYQKGETIARQTYTIPEGNVVYIQHTRSERLTTLYLIKAVQAKVPLCNWAQRHDTMNGRQMLFYLVSKRLENKPEVDPLKDIRKIANLNIQETFDLIMQKVDIAKGVMEGEPAYLDAIDTIYRIKKIDRKLKELLNL